MHPESSLLPESVKKLIVVIGMMPTMRLVYKFGGREVKLYNSDRSLSGMASVIGIEATEKLFKFQGNVPFFVPRCSDALKAVRNSAIHTEFDRMTMEEHRSASDCVDTLARQHALTDRQIWRILNQSTRPALVDVRQLSLL